MPGPHRSIDRHNRWWRTPKCRKTARGRGYRGSATGEAQWPIGLRATGGESPCPPPPRVDVAGQSLNVVGGWARTSADSSWVSGTVAHLSNHRRGARWGDTIADRPPDAGYGRPPGLLSDTAGRSADISMIFLVPYRGRLKRLHLHCRADAVA